MKNAARVLALVSLFLIPSRAAALAAESKPKSPDLADQQLKTIVQEILAEHGFAIEADDVVLIHDEEKIVVAMDVSNNIAENLSDQITRRLRSANLSMNESELEVNLFGVSETSLTLPETLSAPARRWNDILSTRQNSFSSHSSDPGTLTLVLGDVFSPKTTPLEGFSEDLFEQARTIILAHLRQIKETGVMQNNILMESYWKNVFTTSGSEDLYTVGKPLISQALKAGIRPYREGKPLSAIVFADLAIKAVRTQTGLIPLQSIVIHP